MVSAFPGFFSWSSFCVHAHSLSFFFFLEKVVSNQLDKKDDFPPFDLRDGNSNSSSVSLPQGHFHSSLTTFQGISVMATSATVSSSTNARNVSQSSANEHFAPLDDELIARLRIERHVKDIRHLLARLAKNLDLQAVRGFSLTNDNLCSKPPQDVLTSERRRNFDILFAFLSVLPRFFPLEANSSELVELLCRCTIHYDKDVRELARSHLSHMVAILPSLRTPIFFSYLQFFSSQLLDHTSATMNVGLRVLLNMICEWQSVIKEDVEEAEANTTQPLSSTNDAAKQESNTFLSIYSNHNNGTTLAGAIGMSVGTGNGGLPAAPHGLKTGSVQQSTQALVNPAVGVLNHFGQASSSVSNPPLAPSMTAQNSSMDDTSTIKISDSRQLSNATAATSIPSRMNSAGTNSESSASLHSFVVGSGALTRDDDDSRNKNVNPKPSDKIGSDQQALTTASFRRQRSDDSNSHVNSGNEGDVKLKNSAGEYIDVAPIAAMDSPFVRNNYYMQAIALLALCSPSSRTRYSAMALLSKNSMLLQSLVKLKEIDSRTKDVFVTFHANVPSIIRDIFAKANLSLRSNTDANSASKGIELDNCSEVGHQFEGIFTPRASSSSTHAAHSLAGNGSATNVGISVNDASAPMSLEEFASLSVQDGGDLWTDFLAHLGEQLRAANLEAVLVHLRAFCMQILLASPTLLAELVAQKKIAVKGILHHHDDDFQRFRSVLHLACSLLTINGARPLAKNFSHPGGSQGTAGLVVGGTSTNIGGGVGGSSSNYESATNIIILSDSFPVRLKPNEMGVKDFLRLMVQILRSDIIAIWQTVAAALSFCSVDLTGLIMEELWPLMKEAMDLCAEPSRKRRRRDHLRHNVICVVNRLSSNLSISCNMMTSSCPFAERLARYINGTRSFLEMEAGGDSGNLADLRLNFCSMVATLAEGINDPKTYAAFFSEDLRMDLYLLMSKWCAKCAFVIEESTGSKSCLGSSIHSISGGNGTANSTTAESGGVRGGIVVGASSIISPGLSTPSASAAGVAITTTAGSSSVKSTIIGDSSSVAPIRSSAALATKLGGATPVPQQSSVSAISSSVVTSVGAAVAAAVSGSALPSSLSNSVNAFGEAVSLELDLAAYRAVCSLGRGPMFDYSKAIEHPGYFCLALQTGLMSDNDAYFNAAQHGIVLLLKSNLDKPELFEWLLHLFYSSSDARMRSGAFFAVAELVSQYNYPANKYQLLILALCGFAGDHHLPRSQALAFLLHLRRKFFQHLEQLELTVWLTSANFHDTYSEDLQSLSEYIATQLPGAFSPLFLDISMRFSGCNPVIQQRMLALFVPWLKRFSLSGGVLFSETSTNFVAKFIPGQKLSSPASSSSLGSGIRSADARTGGSGAVLEGGVSPGRLGCATPGSSNNAVTTSTNAITTSTSLPTGANASIIHSTPQLNSAVPLAIKDQETSGMAEEEEDMDNNHAKLHGFHVINNLFYISVQFYSIYPAEMGQVWLALAHQEPNISAIFTFFAQQCSLRDSGNFLEHAQEISTLICRAFPDRAVNYLLQHLHATKLQPARETEVLDIATVIPPYSYLAPLTSHLPLANSVPHIVPFDCTIFLLAEVVVKWPAWEWGKHLPELLHVSILAMDNPVEYVLINARRLVANVIRWLVWQSEANNPAVSLEAAKKFIADLTTSNMNVSYWRFEDPTPSQRELASFQDLRTMVNQICIVLVALGHPNVMQLWALHCLEWAKSCPISHYILRSFQVLHF